MGLALPLPIMKPDLSLVMPAYNEEAIVGQTIQRTLQAFQRAGYRLELIAVDNGSRDRTGEIIQAAAAKDPAVVPHRVEVNQGYGFGVLSGFPRCTADWVGVIAADGQVDAEDAVRLYEGAISCGRPVIAKARRRFRMDGPIRKVISIGWQVLFRLCYPRVASIDINGVPKLMPRDVMQRMQLTSKEWFLDPEIMIKAHYMRLPVLEYNVFARMRGNGLSHVRAGTVWNFFRTLLVYRFSPRLSRWRKEIRAEAARVEPAGQRA
jgi:glycosyltransferase involved in cell wall biosynthesis